MDWAFALCGGGGGGGIVQREQVGYQEEVAKPAVLLNNHDDPGNHFPCSLPHLVLWWTAVRITQKSTHAVWPLFSGAVKKEEKEKVYCTWYIYIYILVKLQKGWSSNSRMTPFIWGWWAGYIFFSIQIVSVHPVRLWHFLPEWLSHTAA